MKVIQVLLSLPPRVSLDKKFTDQLAALDHLLLTFLSSSSLSTSFLHMEDLWLVLNLSLRVGEFAPQASVQPGIYLDSKIESLPRDQEVGRF